MLIFIICQGFDCLSNCLYTRYMHPISKIKSIIIHQLLRDIHDQPWLSGDHLEQSPSGCV